MFKQTVLGMALCLGLFVSAQNAYAQTKTNDELKAEREALKSEMKSKEAQERQKKLAKLEAPKDCGITSIDQLAVSSATILGTTKNINIVVPEMYKRTIGETIDGVTDVTVKKPTPSELLDLSLNIATQIKTIADASSAVANASNDVKSASPMQAPKATKSLNFTKDVLAITSSELQLSAKIVANLIETLKSANNN